MSEREGDVSGASSSMERRSDKFECTGLNDNAVDGDGEAEISTSTALTGETDELAKICL